MKYGPIAYYEVRWRDTQAIDEWEYKTYPADTTTITISTHLRRGTSYYIEARSVGPSGLKSIWVDVSHTVEGNIVPQVPQSLVAAGLADGVRLTWSTQYTASPGTIYCIERSTDGATGWVEVLQTTNLYCVVKETVDGTFYYRIRSLVSVDVYSAYSVVVSGSPNTLAEMQTQITASQTDATNALNQLADIANDNLLTPGEKPVAIQDRDKITDEQASLDSEATAYGITTEKTNYDNAVSALTSYLATLTSPTLWSNLSGNTTIVGTTFRQKFKDVYNARTALLVKIYDMAKQQADLALLLGSSDFRPKKVYSFAGAALPAGITGTNVTVASADSGTSTQLTATTADPRLNWVPNLGPISCYVVAARVKVVSGTWDGSVYYTTAGHGESTSFIKTVAAPKTGVWTTVVWDMRSLTTGGTDFVTAASITGMRLDLGGSSGGVVQVDWIAYGSYGLVSQEDVDKAQTDATSALAQLTDIASDNLLTPGEKPFIIRDRDAIVAEQSGIDTQATNYSVTTEKTTYDNAVSALTSYLATLTSPALWSDLSGNTTIVGTTFRQKFLDVYSAKTAILQKIADKVTLGNLAGRGPNLLWDEYSRFNSATLPTLLDAGTVISQTYDSSTSLFGSGGSLKISVNDATGNINSSWIYYGTSSTDYNIPLEGGKKYIVSGTFKPSVSGVSIRFAIKGDDGAVYTPGDRALSAANVVGRQSVLIDLTAFAGRTGILLIYYNRQGSTIAFDVWQDRLMVEEQLGTLTTPSTWVPGGGGRIATQARDQATSAQTDATNSLNQLSDIANDNLLVPAEKKIVIKDQAAIAAEQSGIDTQATDFGIVTEKTAYDNAVTALNSYLATLTTPVLWSNMTGNTTIVRTTFKQKFLDVYSTRQALLNAIYQAAQNLANGKLAANGDNLVPNPAFTYNDRGVAANTNVPYATPLNVICDGWVVTYDGSRTSGQTAQTQQMWHPTAHPAQLYLAVLKPTALASGSVVASEVMSEKIIGGIREGEQYLLSCSFVQTWDGTATANVLFQSRFFIYWYDGSNAQIGSPTIFTTNRVSGAQVVMDKLLTAPAGAVGYKVGVDAFVQNNTGAAWTHDSTTAMAVSFNWISLVHKMSNTAYLPMLMYGNGRAKVPTVITYSSAAGTPATATINVAAFNLISGSRTIAYNAMSVNLTHAAGTVQYFLYCDDPGAAGGSRTLVATTNGDDVYASEGRLYIGDISVTYPISGTSTGGGGRIDSCVCIDMFLAEDLMAVEARVGLILDCLDLPISDRKFKRRIKAVRFSEEECVELRTDAGAVLRLSVTTPFDLLTGGMKFADEMLGELVVTDHGIEQVTHCEPIGKQPVAKISVGGVSYAAGEDPAHRIFSHNTTKP